MILVDANNGSGTVSFVNNVALLATTTVICTNTAHKSSCRRRKKNDDNSNKPNKKLEINENLKEENIENTIRGFHLSILPKVFSSVWV